MTYPGGEKPDLEDLAHFGVKGMKWGVRKSYTDRRQKVADRYGRVAEGKGSAVDNVRTAYNLRNKDLLTGKGYKGSAKALAKRENEHLNRVRKGEKKVRDIAMISGRHGLTAGDIARGIRNAKNAPK